LKRLELARPPARMHHLKAVERNPRLARMLLDEGDVDDPSYAMERGIGVHHLVFGTRRVAGFEGKQRRGKEWEAFERENSDATILTAKEYEKAQRMAEAVLFDPWAAPLLEGAVFEGTLLFDLNGRACRVTPDIRHPVTHVADLKTCKSAKPEEFLRDAFFRRYFAQVAWQRLGTELALGYRPPEGFIIAVESAPPWAVTVVELTQAKLDEGEAYCREQLAKLVACEERDVWPSYTAGRVPWDVSPTGPMWMPEDDDQGDEDEETAA